MRVFKALDRLSSVSASKVMLKKFQIHQEFSKEFSVISIINSRYFGDNFGTRNARKSIKSSKDLYYSLESNKNFESRNRLV